MSAFNLLLLTLALVLVAFPDRSLASAEPESENGANNLAISGFFGLLSLLITALGAKLME